MSWGYKILFVYIIFVAGILFLVFKSAAENQDLVTQDYYEQELKYQDRINETERANALSAPVKYELDNGKISIQLPEEMKGREVKAHVLLYCTVDKTRDIQQDITTNDASITLALTAANKGLHELKITWTEGGTSYYYGHKLYIQ